MNKDKSIGAPTVGMLETVTGGVEGAQPPYRIMRVYTGSQGVPGR
ncbi:MAG: hypothetical protein WBG92_12525 [Thiohalocapsa sp.]